jgi:hypothetical protein
MPPHLPEGNALKLANAASSNLRGHGIFSIQAAVDGHGHVASMLSLICRRLAG